MGSRITTSDYIKILNYYKLDIPKNTSDIKQVAEDILAVKLCRCIKKLGSGEKKKEARSIGICSKTIFNRKGLTRGKFKCKKGRNVTFIKTRKGALPLNSKNKTTKNKTTKKNLKSRK